jgi:hypothetical protein
LSISLGILWHVTRVVCYRYCCRFWILHQANTRCLFVCSSVVCCTLLCADHCVSLPHRCTACCHRTWPVLLSCGMASRLGSACCCCLLLLNQLCFVLFLWSDMIFQVLRVCVFSGCHFKLPAFLPQWTSYQSLATKLLYSQLLCWLTFWYVCAGNTHAACLFEVLNVSRTVPYVCRSSLVLNVACVNLCVFVCVLCMCCCSSGLYTNKKLFDCFVNRSFSCGTVHYTDAYHDVFSWQLKCFG